MQRARDNPSCADAELASILDVTDPGLSYNLTFDPAKTISSSVAGFVRGLKDSLVPSSRPKVAVLREQGVNGQAEMAFAFMVAGFTAVDVHMSELMRGEGELAGFVGLAACGGFSYGVRI